MALQKRSRLHQVHLTFDENGTYVSGDALFQEGAWDTDTQMWEGKPVAREYPIHNADAAGKKFLNDVIGVAATKALETAAVATEALKGSREKLTDYAKEFARLDDELKNALDARDNFAALHKEAKGELMAECQRRDEIIASQKALSERIPRLIRRMFGAI